MIKTCATCGISQDISMYSKAAHLHDGKANKCKLCVKLYNRETYLANPERAKRQAMEWQAKNPDKVKAIMIKAACKYRKNNPDKTKLAVKTWSIQNPDKLKARDQRRKARSKSAVTNWDFELDRFVEAEALDLKAKREAITKFQWHTDHIVPLAGIHVTGLHNAFNLAVIPAKYNMSKKNRFNEAMLSNREWL